MDSTNTLEQIDSGQASNVVTANNLFAAASPAIVYGRHEEACAGLTWAYYGGRWGGTLVASGTLEMVANATNYIVVNRSTAAVSASTSSSNWNSDTTYARAYKVYAGAASVTWDDCRAGPGGTAFAVPAVPSGTTAGRHAIYVPAGAMRPSFTGGCAALQGVATGANQPDLLTLDFDTTTQEFAQFSLRMPASWDEGTITFAPCWSHSATTTNFGAVWQLQGVAVSNDDTVAVNYGTAQTSADTGGTTNDLYVGPESSAITLAGSPAAEDMVFFRVGRVPADGSDTMAIDARLHGLTIYVTTNADNDS